MREQNWHQIILRKENNEMEYKLITQSRTSKTLLLSKFVLIALTV